MCRDFVKVSYGRSRNNANRRTPPNFGVKLMRPGFGPAAQLPAFSPASRRHGGGSSPLGSSNVMGGNRRAAQASARETGRTAYTKNVRATIQMRRKRQALFVRWHRRGGASRRALTAPFRCLRSVSFVLVMAHEGRQPRPRRLHTRGYVHGTWAAGLRIRRVHGRRTLRILRDLCRRAYV